MDLTLDVEDYKLNIRTAGLIIHNNKVLTHRDVTKDHYCLPGGRVELGESSDKTIKREMEEELGKEIELIEYVSTIEIFFEMEGKKYHEIYFLYKVDFENEEDKKIEYTLKNKEGKDYLQYEWVDLNKIDEYSILPICLKDIIKENKFPVHKINDDMAN